MATIKIKRSSTPNLVGPDTNAGEISANLADKKLFIGTGGSGVITFNDAAAVTQEISSAIGGLSGAFEYKGTLDANGDAYSAGGPSSGTPAFVVLGSGGNTLKLEFTHTTEPTSLEISSTSSGDPTANTFDESGLPTLYFMSANSTFADVISAASSNANITATLTGSDTTSLSTGTFSVTGSTSGSTATALPSNPDVGDYYKVKTAGYFTDGVNEFFVNVGDAVVHNSATSGQSWDVLDNTNSTVAGTTNVVDVSGSTEAGYTVNIASNFLNSSSTHVVDGGSY